MLKIIHHLFFLWYCFKLPSTQTTAEQGEWKPWHGELQHPADIWAQDLLGSNLWGENSQI